MNQLTRIIFTACQDKKAVSPVLLDLAEVQSYAHHVVIVSATNNRQVQAIVDHVLDESFKETSLRPLGVEGYDQALWVLIDFGSVVCHVFQEEERQIYHLEDMWPRVKSIEEKDVIKHLNTKKKKTHKQSKTVIS